MKALIINHKGFLGITARFFPDDFMPVVIQRLTDIGFVFDGVTMTRAVAGTPTAVAAVVDVVDNGFSVDGGCGAIETTYADQVMDGFDILTVLTLEPPAWYAAYLASLQ